MIVAHTSSAGWALAYRPLRPRGLLAQLIIVVGAEVLLYISYSGHQATFHWATHFLVGLTAAVASMSVTALRVPPVGSAVVDMLVHASPIALRRTLTSRDHRWFVGIGVAVLLALVLLAHSPIGAGHMDMADATPAHAQAQMCLATVDGGHALVPLSAPLVVLTRPVKPANVRISAVAYRPAAMAGGPARAGPAFLCVDRR